MSDRTRVQAALEGLFALVVADATLIALLGSADNVGQFETEELTERTPTSIFYELIDAGLDENFEPALIRWHIWAKPENVLLIEARLRLIAHPEAQTSMGGATVISRCRGSFPAGGSKRAGMARRIVETELLIVRQRALV